MASPVTFANLILQATSLSDQTNSSFISQTEWGYYINGEASDLYRRIAQADPDRYIQRNPTYTMPLQTGYLSYSASTGTFTAGETLTGGTSAATASLSLAPDNVVGNTLGTLYVGFPTGTFVSGETVTGGSSGATAVLSSTYVVPSQFNPLPSDFWLVNRVDYVQTPTNPIVFQTILAANLMEEDSYQYTMVSFYGQGLRYRLQNNFLCLFPAPTITGTLQFLYTPAYQNLVDPSDTLDSLCGFEDYVTFGAAARALQKENNFQQAATLLGMQQRTEKELERIAQATRDKATPATTISLRNKMNGRGGGYRTW